MSKYKIFYSFDYDTDVFRVQQIRQIGVLEGNEPVTPNKWESVKKEGDSAIQKWIDEGIANCECFICLIGEHTYTSKWVDYEIRKAWALKKPIIGIYIDDLRDPRLHSKPPHYGKSLRGRNPFGQITIGNVALSSVISTYIPSASDAYNDIANKIESWIVLSIKNRRTL